MVGVGVLESSESRGVAVGRDVEGPGLDAFQLAALGGVAVYGDEEIGAGFVGDTRTVIQRDEGVVAAGHDHAEAEGLELRRDLAGNGQGHVLLASSVLADGAGILAAVTCIDDDSPYLQSEL